GREELGVITFDEVTARIEAEERIRFMARYDNLTGLANRAYFHEVVVNRVTSGSPERDVALVIFVLDDFKSINDTLGHPVGDGLLYATAERLVEIVGETARVGRFGGDEFMLFFDNVVDMSTFPQELQRIFDR